MEAFWATLKAELVKGRLFDLRAQTPAVLFDYIEVFYNRARLHGAHGFQTPVEIESELS